MGTKYPNVINLDTEFSNDHEEAKQFLISKGYRKIGHIKNKPCGFCINTYDKRFFECEEFRNPHIDIVFDKSELKL